ncbi:MAG TPA: serine/threonine protein kinase [Cyanobacteria bacterium UBA11049]|nr:serine/threonine protein kinase [Cyanobacteria bacterium UBA11049]
MIGKLLDHRYQVIRVLATGGFGQTYIAEDTRRPGNPVCVVKHLKPSSSDPKMFGTAKRLFNAEAETLEKLGYHDQIPRLLAYFDENQEFFLVQEFIEGHPLSDELASDECWSESLVIHLLEEVLSILVFVHSQGVIHRDIKPDNIIRRASDNKLVLVDFGAVKQLRSPALSAGAQPSATVAIGTPGYMPTEQGQGKPRPNSDIYALGMIAIQALTGVAPMQLQEDPYTGETIWQHLASVSPDLAAVLTKMVRYHFKDRYQSAAQALQTIESLLGVSTPAGYPTTQSHQLVKASSPQSRQKTLAVAPANPAVQVVEKQPVPARKSSGGIDLFQLLLVVGLAGGAAAVAPTVAKNFQDFSANFANNNDNNALAQNCLAVVRRNSNIRSEPSSLNSENVLRTVSVDSKFEVTGKQTKHGWVEVELDGKKAWAQSNKIKNNEQWMTCLRDKNIAIKIVDDSALISQEPAPKPKAKPVKNVSEKSQPSSGDHTAKLLEQAQKKYESGDLQGAIALLKSIPANTSAVKETTEVITHWQQDWNKSEALFNDINQALNDGQWDKVLAYKDHPEKLPNVQYWRNKIEPMFQQAAEKAKQQLTTEGKPDNQNSKQELPKTKK